MNLTPLDDVLDKHFGKIGTPKRDAFESDVDVALHAYRLGEAIKKARIEQNLTQEQLGERIGVKRAQISRLERGYSITIPTMRRVFKALGVVTATIDLGIAGKVALWYNPIAYGVIAGPVMPKLFEASREWGIMRNRVLLKKSTRQWS